MSVAAAVKRDPCRIMLRWYAGCFEALPAVGEYLVAARTAYLITNVNSRKKPDHFKLSITALRFAIPDVPATAVCHAMTWDSRGKKK
jgi:hypothetical protein